MTFNGLNFTLRLSEGGVWLLIARGLFYHFDTRKDALKFARGWAKYRAMR